MFLFYIKIWNHRDLLIKELWIICTISCIDLDLQRITCWQIIFITVYFYTYFLFRFFSSRIWIYSTVIMYFFLSLQHIRISLLWSTYRYYYLPNSLFKCKPLNLQIRIHFGCFPIIHLYASYKRYCNFR